MTVGVDAQLLAELGHVATGAKSLWIRLATAIDPNLRYRGADSDDLVQVIVDGSGRAVDVRVSRVWRRDADTDQLKRAAVTAAFAADRRRLEGWASTAAAPSPAVRPPVGDRLLGTDNPAPSRFDGLAGEDLIRVLLSTLDGARQHLDEVGEHLRDRITTETVLADADGHVAVHTRSGMVTQIDFHPLWIENAAADEIGYRLCELFQAGYDRAWSDLCAGWPGELRDLAALMAEPERLTHRLGLVA